MQRGKRRLVDPHWFRGSVYLKIAWKWMSDALRRGYELMCTVTLQGTTRQTYCGKEDDQVKTHTKSHEERSAVPFRGVPCSRRGSYR
jgi:hypothetical protein